MNEGQKVLMLNENYNIYKILDNTTIGFFLGIISGIGIDVFMTDNINFTKISFSILCIFSIILLLKSMAINTKFIQNCQDIVLIQNEYQHREKIIEKLTKETKKLQLKFKMIFWLAITILFIAITIVKIPLLQKHSNTSNNSICPCCTVHLCHDKSATQNTYRIDKK